MKKQIICFIIMSILYYVPIISVTYCTFIEQYICGIAISICFVVLLLWFYIHYFGCNIFHFNKKYINLLIKAAILQLLYCLFFASFFEFADRKIFLDNKVNLCLNFYLPTISYRFVLFFIRVAIMAPIVEELIFRVLLQGYLINKTKSSWIGILVTSIIFSLYHMSISQLIPTFIAGILFGWIYYKTNYFWIPVCCHCINNLLALFFKYKYVDINVYWFLVYIVVIFLTILLIRYINQTDKNEYNSIQP